MFLENHGAANNPPLSVLASDQLWQLALRTIVNGEPRCSGVGYGLS